jgi:hypothetical protein
MRQCLLSPTGHRSWQDQKGPEQELFSRHGKKERMKNMHRRSEMPEIIWQAV